MIGVGNMKRRSDYMSRPKTYFAPEEVRRIISLYNNGLTVKEIKRTVQSCKYLVNKILKNNGCTKRTNRLSEAVIRMWKNQSYRAKQRASWKNGRRDVWKKRCKIRAKHSIDHVSWKGRKGSIERKKRLIEAYGGKCECCEEKIVEFLTIDHKSSKIRKFHRHSCGAKGGGQLYKWLEKNGYPKNGIQLLCMNCNLATSYGRVCPHKRAV